MSYSWACKVFSINSIMLTFSNILLVCLYDLIGQSLRFVHCVVLLRTDDLLYTLVFSLGFSCQVNYWVVWYHAWTPFLELCFHSYSTSFNILSIPAGISYLEKEEVRVLLRQVSSNSYHFGIILFSYAYKTFGREKKSTKLG